jgi:hypothetical protein
MATFSQLNIIAADNGFQQRVRFAMVTAAIAIYNEPTNTPGHLTRSTYAVKIINGNINMQAMALAVLTNPTVAAEADPTKPPDFAIPDSDIQFQVNSMWNSAAGV